MLACPQCNGQVSATNHQCEFCTAPLLVRACPSCFRRVFHGHKHCPACGCNTTEPANALESGEAARFQCPRCEGSPDLEAELIDDVLLDSCLSCHGVWVDHVALEKILDARRQARADAVLTNPSKGEMPQPHTQGRMYIRCPECEQMMNRKAFATGAGVIVDVCRHHGTWFDAQELSKVVEFATKGGLERAAKRDAERLREEAKMQRHSAQMQAQRAVRYQDSGGSHNRFASLLSGLGKLL